MGFIQKFIEQSKTNNLGRVGFPKTYNDLSVRVSFGVGNAAKIPWIAFLKSPNKVTDGIYPVYLYYKEINKLILAYGLSETNTSSFEWNLSNKKSIKEWYNEKYGKNPYRYGDSFIMSVYDLDEDVDFEQMQKDLDKLIETYKELHFDNVVEENKSKYIIDNQKKELFSWVKTHQEITHYLKDKEDAQQDLIDLLKTVGIGPFNNDEDDNSVKINLTEIDPFTFFFFIYKYGTKNRLEFLQKIAEKLNIYVPNDDSGIPSAQGMKLWLFPYKRDRTNNEIKRLWKLFFSAKSDSITDEQFKDVLSITSTGKTKITEGLYDAYPEKYFPINGPTKPYLKEVLGIDPSFETFTEYNNILKQIKSRSKKPFYQISFEAWQWNDEQKKDNPIFSEVINKFSQEELTTYFNFLYEIVDHLKLSPRDSRVVYSCGKTYLNINIGQRFVWRLKPKKGSKYWIMTDKKLENDYLPFDGPIKHFYKTFNDFEEINKNRESCFRAIETEYKRSINSGYKKHNNEDFERAVFDKKFREQFIKAESMGNNNEVVNKILYGPPGTGKTFYLKDQLFDKYTSKETSISQEQNFETVVSGCSWWQVIAIALLDIGRSKVSDVFEHEWVQKKASLSNSKTVRQTLWGQLQSHTIDNCEYVNVTNRQTPQIFTKSEDSYWKILEDQVEELVPELYELRDSVENYNPDPDKIIKHYDFVTFHQSFAYEDFIEGIKPIIPEIDSEEEFKDLGYTIEDGVFKNLCRKAKIDPENRYAIFIDEINRGNVSAIFGELITLIETDKRSGAKNELSIKLPYSKKNFSVPSNLDIYGTMNTADRSVEALDTALRRRFEFKEMMPDYRVIKDQKVGDIQLSEVLQTINERIEILVDRDHTIGHSYFINVNSKKALANAFNNKIVPLLQEYFYGDYGKIGLVLGEGFVKKTETKNIEFATFKYDDSEDFKTPKYNLIKVNKSNIITAIETLLGKVNESSED